MVWKRTQPVTGIFPSNDYRQTSHSYNDNEKVSFTNSFKQYERYFTKNSKNKSLKYENPYNKKIKFNTTVFKRGNKSSITPILSHFDKIKIFLIKHRNYKDDNEFFLNIAILLANYIDLHESRQITRKEVAHGIDEYNILFEFVAKKYFEINTPINFKKKNYGLTKRIISLERLPCPDYQTVISHMNKFSNENKIKLLNPLFDEIRKKLFFLNPKKHKFEYFKLLQKLMEQHPINTQNIIEKHFELIKKNILDYSENLVNKKKYELHKWLLKGILIKNYLKKVEDNQLINKLKQYYINENLLQDHIIVSPF